jgi:hypothetical protein
MVAGSSRDPILPSNAGTVVPFIAVCPHCRNCRLRAPSRKRGVTMPCPKCQRDFALVPDEAQAACDSPAASSALPVPPAAHADDSPRLALLPFAAVGVALFLCYFPFGRFAAIALVLAGGALACLSLLDRRAWLGWPGVGLNGLLLLTLVAFPGQLKLSGWWPESGMVEPNQAAGISPDGWVDAGEAGWEEDGVQVALTFATVGPDPTAQTSAARTERFLWIGVKVTNDGPRAVTFAEWGPASTDAPRLATADGAIVPPRRSGGTPAKLKLGPGKSLECLLAFEVPPPERDLLLELPASAFGGTTPVRFRIPHPLILSR